MDKGITHVNARRDILDNTAELRLMSVPHILVYEVHKVNFMYSRYFFTTAPDFLDG